MRKCIFDDDDDDDDDDDGGRQGEAWEQRPNAFKKRNLRNQPVPV